MYGFHVDIFSKYKTVTPIFFHKSFFVLAFDLNTIIDIFSNNKKPFSSHLIYFYIIIPIQSREREHNCTACLQWLKIVF